MLLWQQPAQREEGRRGSEERNRHLTTLKAKGAWQTGEHRSLLVHPTADEASQCRQDEMPLEQQLQTKE